MIPKVHYADTGSGLVAYQLFGTGALDVILCEGFGCQIELAWEHPSTARFLEGLGTFARVAFFDQRGYGLSDDVPHKLHPTWEDAVEDFKCVAASAGMARPALLLSRSAGRAGMLFAATNPDRSAALILVNANAYYYAAPDYPQGHPPDRARALDAVMREKWGTEELAAFFEPSLVGDSAALRWLARMNRASASPSRMMDAMNYSRSFDARPYLSAIRVPTLVLQSADYPFTTVAMGRYVAEHIAGAQFVVIPGSSTTLSVTQADAALARVREFLTGGAEAPAADRVLATVVFIDLVGSSELAAQIGDRRWSDIQRQFFGVAREELGRHGGREIDTAGDGYFAVFDGPGRAVRFAERVRSRMEDFARPLRVGIHVGECERAGEKLTGLAVNIGARVCAKAEPGEILVSGTVRDLLIGSGLKLVERGLHRLKGIPGEWLLLALA